MNNKIRYGSICLYFYLFQRMEIDGFFFLSFFFSCPHVFSCEWVYNVIILIIWINVWRSLISSARNINSDSHENVLSRMESIVAYNIRIWMNDRRRNSIFRFFLNLFCFFQARWCMMGVYRVGYCGTPGEVDQRLVFYDEIEATLVKLSLGK